ncbi:IS5/IS1182 family transposase, partial [Treponema endosymbiont of Eucomonympha sp.]|uniref:IS5/IS1182 family transposase n=1 Tax=Treponema endosymbiont of Eucomonympha sp. TaxID=1580831 RepID=UPI0007519DA3
IAAVIPPVKSRKKQRAYSHELYRARHVIENVFRALKRWRGIATRYAKLTASFIAAIRVRYLFLYLPVHTTAERAETCYAGCKHGGAYPKGARACRIRAAARTKRSRRGLYTAHGNGVFELSYPDAGSVWLLPAASVAEYKTTKDRQASSPAVFCLRAY